MPPASRYSVYVIHDLPAARALLCWKLQMQGYRVETAESTHAAVEWMIAHPAGEFLALVADFDVMQQCGQRFSRAMRATKCRFRSCIFVSTVSRARATASCRELSLRVPIHILSRAFELEELSGLLKRISETLPRP